MIGVTALGRIKGQQHLTAAAEHNKRTLYAQGEASDKIDPGRSHLNYSLGGCADPGAIIAKWLQLRDAAGVTTPGRSNEVSAIEFVLSLPPGAEAVINLHDYFTDGTDFICSMFGGRENLLSSDVHLDQEQPHCHILIMPLVNGRMAGAELIRGTGPNYSKLHDDFHRQVASRYGLTKPGPKLQGKSKEEAVQAALDWLDSLADDGERWRATEALTKKYMRKDPRPYMDPSGPGKKPTTGRPPRTLEQTALSRGRGPKTRAAADASDRRLMRRGSSSEREPQARGQPEEGYSLSTIACDAPEPLHTSDIAFPAAAALLISSDAKPAGGRHTEGYALYSHSSSQLHSPVTRPSHSRYRKAPTSAAVDALAARPPLPTMGVH